MYTQVKPPNDVIALKKRVLENQNRYSKGITSSSANLFKQSIATVIRDETLASSFAILNPEQKKNK